MNDYDREEALVPLVRTARVWNGAFQHLDPLEDVYHCACGVRLPIARSGDIVRCPRCETSYVCDRWGKIHVQK